jgi:predicted O-methyltransferase YrrM
LQYFITMKTLPEVLELTKDVNALLCEEDKEALYFYAKMVKHEGYIVDIGTASGASAFIMALSSRPSVTVLTMDPIKNADFEFNMQRLGLEGKLAYYEGPSVRAYEEFCAATSREVDMIFIDGVHNSTGVKRDWKTWGSRLKKGGFVLFHDYLLYSDIGDYVDELVFTKQIIKLKIVEATFRDDPRPIGLFVGEKL